MIADVTFEKTTYQPAPSKFEAGTGNIADAVGLGAALDYVQQVGMESIAAYEHDLLNYGTAALLTVPGLRLIGTAREKAGVMSFVLDDMRTEDVGVALNEEGIAVRSGHHCAQPILRRMGVESTVRPSLAAWKRRLYGNQRADDHRSPIQSSVEAPNPAPNCRVDRIQTPCRISKLRILKTIWSPPIPRKPHSCHWSCHWKSLSPTSRSTKRHS